jgi:long-chain acyl-CoA synthetase
MINVSGFNVYPNEVEQVVGQFRSVLESACIGIPDSGSGETVKIVVVTTDGCDIEPAALLQHCRKQLTAYKVPKSVEFVTQLPKTPVGKVLRRRVRELYGA